ncbi:MAG: hypothetical protein CMP24_06225 [Rickettsiales bacterium]|nr:hypothetical protein [Rickettsiales bacterium]|tara:strand:- start:275 stop:1639 length:1365 start_codon:yes stop_codon:yes gene_type:complete
MKSRFTYIILILINIANLSFSTKSETIYDSMATAYTNSPSLKSLRAKLKASDEEVSKVLSSKRPTVNFSGNFGRDSTTTINTSGVESTVDNSPTSVELEIKQNLYDSGRSKYNLGRTDSMIFAERAELASMEQKILLSTAQVYLELFTAIDLNKLAKNNLLVLKQHLNATKSRFEVGEVTTTDLSQAKARYLKARANEIKSKGDVEIQKSKYFSLIGKEAPETLMFPEYYPDLPKSLKEAIQLAIKNNPKVVAAGFRKKSSFLDISLAAANLLPKLDLNLSAQNAWDPNTFFDEYKNYSIDLSLNVPLYQGGKNYADVRKKKKIAIEKSRNFDFEIREAVKDVEVVWLSLKNTQYQIKAIESSIFANNTALKGVREEEKVGTRTTLDVLDAEQELLEEKMVLVKAKKDLFFFSFQLLEKLGRLNPQSLKLNVKEYDKNAYYNKIKKLWLGFEPN